ncbi:MAG: TCP-1/cpn60 chaperonin family protein [Bacillota bacterium]|nr:TCP-1/cpn60 chaperonin family protein [Bacillota bacterium]
MSLKQVNNKNSEVDEKLAALITNANAIRAISAAVEGTLGPKGLDTMLVDKFGDVVITNDGVTILNMMEASHPAARMLINTAKAQQDEIGDGTTTTTIMAGALVNEGLNQVVKGVPVARVIEGIRLGTNTAVSFLEEQSRKIHNVNDPILEQVALVAGREHQDIAALVTEAAKLIGWEKLMERNFKLADTVAAQVGADNHVFAGVVIAKGPVAQEMPKELEQVKLLIVDDALEPEEIEEEALTTEAGFNHYLANQRSFAENIQKLCQLGVKLVLVDRGISDLAEEICTDAGVMVIQRVSSRQLRKAAEHTGARPIKRTGLKKNSEELEKYVGYAEKVVEDERLEQTFIYAGGGKPMATILVGAATEEVVGERERIAKDAAAAVQAAIKGGLVPGGGSMELAASLAVENMRRDTKGMAAYGVDCVIEALRKPFVQIVSNSGYNALEKLGDVLAAQSESDSNSLAMDCDSGQTTDMWNLGIVDPSLVKIHALKAASEVAQAILRIDTIIKKKESAAGGIDFSDE